MIFFSVILFILYALIILLAVWGFLFVKTNTGPVREPGIFRCSILIPARNEAQHILQCLASIERQNTDQVSYEIIVLDDFSEDDTVSIVTSFFQQYPIGRLIRLAEHIPDRDAINSFKKKAIEIGVAHAAFEWIVQTDADCTVGENWLQTLAHHARNDQVHFLAAPVVLTGGSSSFFQKLLYGFQSIDFMTMQGITAATHYFQVGNMCNGANLAFRKSSFQAINGFHEIDGIASGDDMLLLHKMLKQFPGSSRYIKSGPAIVSTAAQPTLYSFIQQRIRWSSKAAQYKDKRLTWILSIVYLYNLWLLILCIFSIFHTHYLHLLLYLFCGKVLTEYLLVIPVSIFFSRTKQLLLFPFLQPLHILYIVTAGFLGMTGKYQWKGRTVK